MRHTKRRRQAYIFLSLAAILIGSGFILWVWYRLDPGRFPAWFSALFAVLGGLGVLIGVIGAALADIFLPLWDRLKSPEPAALPRLSESKPIRRVDYETLVARLGRSGRIPWVDRGSTSARTLRIHGQVAIVGWMKSGKTREAAELIRSALAEDLITVVYEPTSALDLIPQELLTAAAIAEVDEHERSLFFVDELGLRPEKERLERLSTCMESIRQVRPDIYFLITIQRERLTAAFETWLKTHHFQKIELPPLAVEQRRELTRSGANILGVAIADDAVDVLASDTDGRPYSIVFALQQMAGPDLAAKMRFDAVRLRQILTQSFSAGELRTLCFDLEIEYDDLSGRNRSEKVQELVAYVERRNRTAELVKLA
ncbi:MAG: hypothetical protein L0322_30945 [Chloroflexi bacterium]|nr:hypothetical protein [Chloroflexota bacterium]MCI0643262.1 hypothetical protein [Chloroflexota bacterium]